MLPYHLDFGHSHFVLGAHMPDNIVRSQDIRIDVVPSPPSGASPYIGECASQRAHTSNHAPELAILDTRPTLSFVSIKATADLDVEDLDVLPTLSWPVRLLSKDV
ncbi:hypothetical protein A7X56_14000 [Stenotrophomonas maltophilia]|nr:hypothetical protein A7X56_14000 [Stenotrophomonas maltophilia]